LRRLFIINMAKYSMNPTDEAWLLTVTNNMLGELGKPRVDPRELRVTPVYVNWTPPGKPGGQPGCRFDNDPTNGSTYTVFTYDGTHLHIDTRVTREMIEKKSAYKNYALIRHMYGTQLRK
jgi:hypothetical protein